MQNFLSFLKIYKLYVRKFGFIRTTLKIASYEIPILNRHIDNGSRVTDLGGGEGLLSALLKLINPGASFQVIELNDFLLNFLVTSQDDLFLEVKKLDVMNLSHIPDTEIYILNDFLHHLSFENQAKLLKSLLAENQSNKKIIIRDVIRGKNFDYFLTKFIDKRLYPDDPLDFRTYNEWLLLLRSLPLQRFELRKFVLGWPSNKFQIVIWK